MKNRYDEPEYQWYVKQCRDAILDSVQTSGKPEHSKTCGRNPKKIDAHITQWYIDALVQEIFNIAWDDFRFRVLDGWNNRTRSILYFSRRSRIRCHYRGYIHYVRNKDHLPKEESAVAVWREHKRFHKDKVRHRGTHSQFSRGSRYKQFHKKNSSARHRMWVRKNLVNQNYDIFVQSVDTERKYFADRWNWD